MCNKVVVIHEGYSFPTEEGFRSNSTSTLIKTPSCNILVDTMTAWDGNILEGCLKMQDVACSDINWLVCTHGHSDHVGCNYLFRNAVHIVGLDISKADLYYNYDLKTKGYFKISDSIKVIATPGHTLQDVSVIVDETSLGKIVIAGDLFENERDVKDDSIWLGAGSEDKDKQRRNRAMVLEIADWIVPGHGPMFRVKKNSKHENHK